jgi:chromosome segregation ATPase
MTETRTPAADTDRSPAAKLVDLIEAAESAATGPARRQLIEAKELALQLGESLTAAQEDAARMSTGLIRERQRTAELEAARVNLARDRNTTLDVLTRVRAELERRNGDLADALTARDAAADRIAELADERDALQRKLDAVTDASIADAQGSETRERALEAELAQLRRGLAEAADRDVERLRAELDQATSTRDRAREAARRAGA